MKLILLFRHILFRLLICAAGSLDSGGGGGQKPVGFAGRKLRSGSGGDVQPHRDVEAETSLATTGPEKVKSFFYVQIEAVKFDDFRGQLDRHFCHEVGQQRERLVPINASLEQMRQSRKKFWD